MREVACSYLTSLFYKQIYIVMLSSFELFPSWNYYIKMSETKSASGILSLSDMLYVIRKKECSVALTHM